LGVYHSFGIEHKLQQVDERIFQKAKEKAEEFKRSIVEEYAPVIVDKTKEDKN